MQKYTIQNLLKQRSFINNRILLFLFIVIQQYFGLPQISHSQNPDSLTAERLTAHADSLFELEKFEEAIPIYKESSEYFNKAKCYEKLLQNYGWIRLSLHYQGIESEYIDYVKSIQHFDTLKNSLAYVWSYLMPLSDIEYTKGNFHSSILYLKEIEKRLHNIDNNKLQEDWILLNNSLSISYKRIDNYKKSLDYANKNQIEVAKFKDPFYIAKNKQSICMILQKNRDTINAINCYKTAIIKLSEIERKQNTKNRIKINDFNINLSLLLAELYSHSKNYEKSQELIIKHYPVKNYKNHPKLVFLIARNYFYLDEFKLFNNFIIESSILHKKNTN